jgi:hypothetical protein
MLSIPELRCEIKPSQIILVQWTEVVLNSKTFSTTIICRLLSIDMAAINHWILKQKRISCGRKIRCGFRTFFTKIGLLKSIFLETVRAPIIISHVALFIPFHISHHIVKMPFTLYVSPITSSATPDRNGFRSYVAGFLKGLNFSLQVKLHVTILPSGSQFFILRSDHMPDPNSHRDMWDELRD